MDTGSFYKGGINITSTLATNGHDTSFTPPATPRTLDYGISAIGQTYSTPIRSHSQESLLGVNQKLDRMLALFMEQKSAVKRGQKETAEIRKQMDTFSTSLSEIKSCVDDLQKSGNGNGNLKKWIPKDLSMSWVVSNCQIYLMLFVCFIGCCKACT